MAILWQRKMAGDLSFFHVAVIWREKKDSTRYSTFNSTSVAFMVAYV